MRAAAEQAGLGARVRASVHDVRTPLPWLDSSLDGVFAHMLLCMAPSTQQITTLVGEVRRVLRPGGKLARRATNAGTITKIVTSGTTTAARQNMINTRPTGIQMIAKNHPNQ
ncbi:class I SAM-dependent methyltransferase [Nonomuraea sp. SYSU D8015]|uniref:class I SAM-dependent methyltransferase n=1 Tax=Nonomuraea sp. SYSU D8015 TaxID=2593644 RepID=UPI0021CEEA3F|nr:class I SAM-dependent methyltransferase [Nonomuraea sp. SYSU D8015]